MSFLSFIPIIGDIIDGATSIIKEIVVDKDKQAEIIARMKELQINAETKAKEMEHEEKMGQIEINKIEAASNDAFVRRARPAAMWVCVTALAYNFILYPFILWAQAIWFPQITPPPLIDAQYLYVILGGLLGLGTMRTLEYTKGVMTK